MEDVNKVRVSCRRSHDDETPVVLETRREYLDNCNLFYMMIEDIEGPVEEDLPVNDINCTEKNMRLVLQFLEELHTWKTAHPGIDETSTADFSLNFWKRTVLPHQLRSLSFVVEFLGIDTMHTALATIIAEHINNTRSMKELADIFGIQLTEEQLAASEERCQWMPTDMDIDTGNADEAGAQL
jgi:hypothetical protein